jgi:hypothetical protein
LNFCPPLFHPKYLPLFLNKYFEIQIGRLKDSCSYLDIHIKWNKNTHHAGLGFGIEVLSYFLAIDIYDNRHWNYEESRWEDYSKEKYHD